jgi:hypothetical protein
MDAVADRPPSIDSLVGAAGAPPVFPTFRANIWF